MLKKKPIFIGILLITCFSVSAQAAIVHGTIYDWSDFEKPLKNTLIEVNSTPVQYIIASNGTYSFNLPSGNYLIKAKYYHNNVLEYSTEEYIQIDKEGDYVRDLLLFPPTDSQDEFLGGINVTTDMDIKTDTNINDYIIPILIISFSAIVIFYFLRKKKKLPNEIVIEPVAMPTEKTEMAKNTQNNELPEDLTNIYDIVIKSGGRMTQKDLRKEVKCSEAKVSLMIADLENRGLVKKIKKGRANIIIAEDKK